MVNSKEQTRKSLEDCVEIPQMWKFNYKLIYIKIIKNRWKEPMIVLDVNWCMKNYRKLQQTKDYRKIGENFWEIGSKKSVKIIQIADWKFSSTSRKYFNKKKRLHLELKATTNTNIEIYENNQINRENEDKLQKRQREEKYIKY